MTDAGDLLAAGAAPRELLAGLDRIAEEDLREYETRVVELLDADDPVIREAAVRLLGPQWRLPSFLDRATVICDTDADGEVRVQAMRGLIAPGSGDRAIAARLYSWLVSPYRTDSEKSLAIFGIPHVLEGPTTSAGYVRKASAFRRAQRSDAASPRDGVPWDDLGALLAAHGIDAEAMAGAVEPEPAFVGAAARLAQAELEADPAEGLEANPALDLSPSNDADVLVIELKRATAADQASNRDSVIALLDHPSATVRTSAIRLLGETWQVDDVDDRYRSIIAEDADSKVRRAAMSALASRHRGSQNTARAHEFYQWALDATIPVPLRQLAASCVASIMGGAEAAVEVAKAGVRWGRDPDAETNVLTMLSELMPAR